MSAVRFDLRRMPTGIKLLARRGTSSRHWDSSTNIVTMPRCISSAIALSLLSLVLATPTKRANPTIQLVNDCSTNVQPFITGNNPSGLPNPGILAPGQLSCFDHLDGLAYPDVRPQVPRPPSPLTRILSARFTPCRKASPTLNTIFKPDLVWKTTTIGS